MDKKVENDIKLAKKNTFVNYLHYTINILLSFFMSPLILEYLGSVNFGVFKTVQKYLGFATVADGRATQSLKWVIANNEGNDDYSKKRQAVGSAFLVWKYFSPILLLILAGLVYYIPYSVNELDPIMFYQVRLLCILLGANLFIVSIIGIPDSVLVGVNQGYRSMSVRILYLVLYNFAMIYVLFLGYDLIGIGIITLFFSIIIGIHIFVLAKKKIVWFGIEKPNKKDFLTFFKFSGWTLSWTFVSKFLLSSEVLLISFLIGGDSVSIFVFSSYIIQIGVTIPSLLTSSFIPSIGKFYGDSEFEHAKRTITNLRNLVFAWAIFIAGMTLFANKIFVEYWVGKEYFIGDISNFLIVLLAIQLIIIRNEGFIINVSLNLKKKVQIGFITVIISLLLGYVFSIYNDKPINGILFGLLFGRLYMFFIFPTMVSKLFNIEKKPFLKILTNILKVVILILFSYVLGQFIPNVSLLLLALLLISFTLFYGMLVFKVVLLKNVQTLILENVIKNFRKLHKI